MTILYFFIGIVAAFFIVVPTYSDDWADFPEELVMTLAVVLFWPIVLLIKLIDFVSDD